MLRTSITQSTHENIENVLAELGGFSKFQVLASFLILMPEIPSAMIAMLPVFVGSEFKDNLNITRENKFYEDFSVFGFNINFGATSLVQEWSLHDSYLPELFTSIFMAGMMSGSITGSQLADRFGRRTIHFSLVFLMSVAGIAAGLAPTPAMYGVMRYFSGLGVGGFYCIYSIYLMEFLTPSWRVICGSISLWFIGEMFLAIGAYCIPSWRVLSILAAIPALIMLLSYPILPETPRFLLCQRKTQEAYKAFQTIARLNGKPGQPPLATVDLLQKVIDNEESSKTAESSTGFLSLWTNPKLRNRLLIFIYIFFAVAFSYYGISFNAKNLSGNPYLNMVYMGLVDMIAWPMGSVFSNPLGRRRVTSMFLTFASAMLFLLMGLEAFMDELPPEYVTLFSFLARLGIGGAWGIITCFCQESFPTVVRSSALGICCFIGNLGGVLSPQIVVGAAFWPTLPYLVFGGLLIVASAFSWALPEMRGKPLENF